MKRWIDAARARLTLIVAGKAAESRYSEELAFHLDMEAQRLVREEGATPDEARRRALASFGGVTRHKEQLREGRGLAWLGGLSLDLRLGARMLAKSPGLTIVGLLGLSVAVAIGAFAFAAISAVTGTSLPLAEGDRIVSIQNYDRRQADEGSATHLHDMDVWRQSLPAVENLSAYRIVERNLITSDGQSAAARIAEMTPSAFRLTRVSPVRGRYLLDADAAPDAAPVVVLGHQLWQSRFRGADSAVGSTLRVGAVTHTIVGIMPAGFAFPVNNQVWTPLRLNPATYPRGKAPAIQVFARLTPGSSLGDLERQIRDVGQRLATTYPETHGEVQPIVQPYARAFLEGASTAVLLRVGEALISLLLVVIGVNVAVLVYARTASRSGEMAVRTALGASRLRIVTQLFAEAFVLSAVAAVIGLAIARSVFRQIEGLIRQSAEDQIPYWMRLEITPGLVIYVMGLAVVAAVIIGVIPALRATRGRVHANLQDLTGGASIRLGRTWTALLISQVAVSVAALPIALSGGTRWFLLAVAEAGTPATAGVVIATPYEDRSSAENQPSEYGREIVELERRLEVNRSTTDVVLMSATPTAERYFFAEVDQPAGVDTAVLRTSSGASVLDVNADFFPAFDVRLLAGRQFELADYSSSARVAMVNRSFVRHMFAGGNALGRQVREVRQQSGGKPPVQGEWLQIVGVIEDFPAQIGPDDVRPKIYRPLDLTSTYPITVAVRGATANSGATAEGVRRTALSIDPGLRFRAIRPLDEIVGDAIRAERMALLAIMLVSLSVVLLSAAGIYALMSFTVTRRRREIGIRIALGANSRRVLAGILGRSMRQIGIGILIGVAGAALIAFGMGDSAKWGAIAIQLLLFASLTAAVGIVATVGPARRALRVHPIETLRSE